MSDLPSRVMQYYGSMLPGQPIELHVPTSELITDLFLEVTRLREQVNKYEQQPDIDAMIHKIMSFDCNPPVRHVELRRSDLRAGYLFIITFRSVLTSYKDLIIHAETIVEACETALTELQNKYGKCPYCGQYTHGGAE